MFKQHVKSYDVYLQIFFLENEIPIMIRGNRSYVQKCGWHVT